MTKLWIALALIAPILLNGTTLYKTYGGSSDEQGYDLLQTQDGGYLIVGSGTFADSNQTDMYIIRTDSLGDTLWTRRYGGTLEEIARSVVQAHTGGYVIAGHSESSGAGGKDIFLIKIGDDGSEVWRSYYGKQNADEEAFCIKRTQDGGYVVAGRTTPHGSEFSDIYLLKVDGMSNPLGTRTYGGTNTDDAYSITQTQDDGFAVTGVSGVTGKRRICVIKTDSSLDTVWSKHFDAGFIAEGWEILETPDCGLVVAGWGDDGAHLMQLSPDGDSIWAQTYVEARYAHSLIQNDDGTYVVTGAMLMSKSPEKFNYKPYLVKTDQNGSTLWTRSLELCSWCYPSSVQRTFDSGYATRGIALCWQRKCFSGQD